MPEMLRDQNDHDLRDRREGGGGSVDGECLDFVLEENAFANEKNFFRQ